MIRFNTEPGFRATQAAGMRHGAGQTAGDAFYAMLIDAHRDLSDAQSELLNARIVLLLANHIGDLGVLQEALKLAHRGVGKDA